MIIKSKKMKKRKSTIKDLLLILYDSIFILVIPNIVRLSDDFNLQKFTLIISVL